MTTILWISRHEMSPAQQSAMIALHGEDVVVEKRPISLEGDSALSDLVSDNPNAYVYVVAGAQHYMFAMEAGSRFGVFANHPGRRTDGGFGLAAVYHVYRGKITRVWENSNPDSDEGDALIPVAA